MNWWEVLMALAVVVAPLLLAWALLARGVAPGERDWKPRSDAE